MDHPSKYMRNSFLQNYQFVHVLTNKLKHGNPPISVVWENFFSANIFVRTSNEYSKNITTPGDLNKGEVSKIHQRPHPPLQMDNYQKRMSGKPQSVGAALIQRERV